MGLGTSYREHMMATYRHWASLGMPFYVEAVRQWSDEDSKAVIAALDAKQKQESQQ